MGSSSVTFGYQQYGYLPSQCNGITVNGCDLQYVVAGTDKVLKEVQGPSVTIHGSESHGDVTDIPSLLALVIGALNGQTGTMECHEGFYASEDSYLEVSPWYDGIRVTGDGGGFRQLQYDEAPLAHLSGDEARELARLLKAAVETSDGE